MELVRFRVKAEPREVLEQLVRSVVANAIAGSLRDEYKEASNERNRSLSQLVPDSAGEPRGWKRRHEVNDRFISELMMAVRCLLDSAKFDSANQLSDWCLALADSLGDAMVRARATVTKRSEEHTSELQSRLHLVCRLLLEKKKHMLENGRQPEYM